MNPPSAGKILLAAVFIIAVIGAGLVLSFNKDKESLDSGIIAKVNGKPIKNVDYQLRLRDASLALPNQNASELKGRVLEDMINAELLFQEATRKYGDLPRNEAIEKIMKEQLGNQKNSEDSNESRIEAEKAKLEAYRKFVEKLRSEATIENY